MKKRGFIRTYLYFIIFTTILATLISVSLLELFYQYSDIKEELLEDDVVVIGNESAGASATDKRCTYHTCFDVYKCESTNDGVLKVYVYPEFKYIYENGSKLVLFMSKEFRQLIDAIVMSKFYTPDPNAACLFVPQIDFLNQENVFLKESSRILASLPYWNKGNNHLLFNMLPGSFPNFFTSLEIDRDKALIAGGGFSTWSYRRTFDISIPIFNAFTADDVMPNAMKGNRQWLVVSSQQFLHHDYVKELEQLATKNDDILLLGKCGNVSLSYRCDRDKHKFGYPNILQKATFCVVIRGNRLGQMELLECMKAGSIPVVFADSYILPFFDVLEWKRAAILLDEIELPLLLDYLRKVSKQRINTMRKQVLFYYEKYFSSMEAITLTTLKVLNERVYPHYSLTHEQWNDPWHSKKTPFFLPLTVPRNMGFTAVILTYDRIESLFNIIRQVAVVPSLAKVLVIWNNQQKVPPSAHAWPKISKPLKVIQTQHNKLSNRFYPYMEIETEAVLALDDDILMLTTDELEFAFEVWCEYPDRIVGFPSRLHKWDNKTNAWRYESEWMSELSLVLTGAAFYHKYFNHMYTNNMPQGLKELVDQWMNCEDIAFNFMVSHATGKPPIKVTPRQKFRCSDCANLTVALSEDLGDHMIERSNCINHFTKMYGLKNPPLISVEFRADPVLYKDKFPPPQFHRFNNIGSL